MSIMAPQFYPQSGPIMPFPNQGTPISTRLMPGQPFPAMTRPMPVFVQMPPQQQKQGISTSAATKTGAAVFGGITLIRALIILPHKLAEEAAKEWPEIVKELPKEVQEAASKITPTGIKWASRSAILAVAGIVSLIATGIGTLIGFGTAKAYNHFAKKEAPQQQSFYPLRPYLA